MGFKTRQELFDNAWRGLEAQGWEQCLRPGSSQCAYRGRTISGHKGKCGLGHSIDDSDYCANMEGIGATNPLIQRAV